MEAFWVYPWLVWLGFWPIFAELHPALSLASVIIVLTVSLLVTRLSIRQKWPMWLIRCVIVGCGLVTIFLVLRIEYGAGDTLLNGWFKHMAQMLGATFTHPYPVVLALPVLLYLWWRGIILGRATLYFSNIYRSFLLGMAAFILLIVLWQFSPVPSTSRSPVSSVGVHVMAFFFFGLLAIAICHLNLMFRHMPREDAALTSAWRYVPIMLGVIGGIVIIGLGVASISSAEFVTSVGQGIKSALNVLGKIPYYLLIPIGYLVTGIYYLLQFVVSWLRQGQSPQPASTDNLSFPEWPAVTPKTLPTEVTLAIKWLVVAAIVAAIIYVLMKAVYRYRAGREREEIEEIDESLWSWNGFQDDLRLLLSMMRQRFKRKPAPVLTRYHIDDDIARRLDIREVFQHLLWEGARSGIARRGHETACEYTERLGQAVPDGREQLTQLADLYNGVRYGDIRAEEAQVDCANSLWQALRGLLRRLRRAQH
jgi:hypothetical protein